MYKLLLCVRYLRTRYIALASIVSVMLGVATMIVVNSVMSGFANEMRERINGILADVIIETNSLNGETDAEFHRQLAIKVAGEHIESISTTVEVFGLMHFRRGGQWIPRPVTIVGMDPAAEAKVGPLVQNLDSFQTIREDGKVARAPLRKSGEAPGWELTQEALAWRKEWKEHQRRYFEAFDGGQKPEPLMENDAPAFEAGEPAFEESASPQTPEIASDQPGVAKPPIDLGAPLPLPNGSPTEPGKVVPASAVEGGNEVRQAANPFEDDKMPNLDGLVEKPTADPDAPLPGRLYIGAQLVEIPRLNRKTGKVFIDRLVKPGDDVKISTVSAGSPPEPRHFFATVVDIYKSGMSEYDANLVFCNLEYLQEMRGMIDPQSGKGAITTMKIKLKNYNENSKDVVKRLENAFPPHLYTVRTWEQKQGPLLAAVDIESAILNVLLFLIIAVAGFGILAIFFMIVVEKTRDIGILKALGASSRGVMSIFLTYGLGLGIVGSGVGVICGLVFVRYINVIEAALSWVTGRKVFDERIYYFPSIPTEVSAWTVAWVALGSILIAVLASVLPARRAAKLHPVEALRYE